MFIVFEGLDNSGKTSMSGEAYNFLKSKELDVELICDPGSTVIGQDIRSIIKNPNYKEMCKETDLLLFLAARCQIIEEKIRHRSKDKIILCDRFNLSTYAYQNILGGWSIEAIQTMEKCLGIDDIVPDVLFYYKITPETWMERKGGNDRIENNGLEFFKKLSKRYDDIVSQKYFHSLTIDATLPYEVVKDETLDMLAQIFALSR